MADIVERLREGTTTAPGCHSPTCGDVDKADVLMAEAADRIEALEAALEEPYGYVFQHEETGLTQVVDAQQIEWGFEGNNPRWQKIGPVYLHPDIPREA
ncbi:hypothetical protein E0H46_31985 [Rhizobium leguminosarum bv. viciae]|nr:hypothetical protein E0H46_31985 [Rhizobium leguminosarum bv. viciae]